MRLAVDTNIVVRYLIEDDPGQFATAVRIIECGETIVLTSTVLCETAWVLRRGYRLSRSSVEATLRDLIESRNVETEGPGPRRGLAMLQRGGDFADGCILSEADAVRCDRLYTFDRTFARLGGDLVSVPE